MKAQISFARFAAIQAGIIEQAVKKVGRVDDIQKQITAVRVEEKKIVQDRRLRAESWVAGRLRFRNPSMRQVDAVAVAAELNDGHQEIVLKHWQEKVSRLEKI